MSTTAAWNPTMLQQMSEGDKLVAVCIGVIRERIGRLPKDDRDELFELVMELPKAATDEESKSIWLTMQEILSQEPMNSSRLPLSDRPPTTLRSKKWAEHVGKCVKKHRDEKGWTQAELATNAGLPQSHISRIERAEYTPTYKTIEKIAKAFGVEFGKIDPSTD